MNQNLKTFLMVYWLPLLFSLAASVYLGFNFYGFSGYEGAIIQVISILVGIWVFLTAAIYFTSRVWYENLNLYLLLISPFALLLEYLFFRMLL